MSVSWGPHLGFFLPSFPGAPSVLSGPTAPISMSGSPPSPWKAIRMRRRPLLASTGRAALGSQPPLPPFCPLDCFPPGSPTPQGLTRVLGLKASLPPSLPASILDRGENGRTLGRAGLWPSFALWPPASRLGAPRAELPWAEPAKLSEGVWTLPDVRWCVCSRNKPASLLRLHLPCHLYVHRSRSGGGRGAPESEPRSFWGLHGIAPHSALSLCQAGLRPAR